MIESEPVQPLEIMAYDLIMYDESNVYLNVVFFDSTGRLFGCNFSAFGRGFEPVEIEWKS